MQDRRTFLGIAAASLLPRPIFQAASTHKHPRHGQPPNWRDTR